MHSCWWKILSTLLKNYIFPSFSRDNFTGYKIDFFFFLEILLKDLFLCLQSCISLNGELSTNHYLCSSICNVSSYPSPLAAFNIFIFITGFQKFDYDMSWCGFLCVYLVWACWDSWVCGFIVHNKFGKNLQIFFLLLSSLSGTLTTYIFI